MIEEKKENNDENTDQNFKEVIQMQLKNGIPPISLSPLPPKKATAAIVTTFNK